MTIIKRIPLEVILAELVYILLEITPRFIYENGQRTEQLEGYVYTVVNSASFDTIRVFVQQHSPLMPPDTLADLRAEGEKTLVEFGSATVTPYISRKNNSIEDKVVAESVSLVTDIEGGIIL